MNIKVAIVAAAVAVNLASTALGGKMPVDDAEKVTACLGWIPEAEFYREAEVLASTMFLEASVDLVWGEGAACREPGAIRIHLADRTAAEVKPDALAYADLVKGNYIVVFYDRIQSHPGTRATRQRLLAHVLVHEITHLLEGVPRHSETGIMKAQWTVHDHHEMAQHPLPFAPEDIELIRAGLRSRAQLLISRK